jgi:mannan endo-1,4-beta-mannosidase
MRPSGLIVALLLVLAPFTDAGPVSISSGHFWVDGHPWFFVGDNVYYLAVMASPGWGNTAAADNTVTMSQAVGLSVWRVWGFCDGTGDCPASLTWQSAPRVYNDTNLRGLDYVIQKAGAAGIKVQIAVQGTYTAHGGIPVILGWCGLTPTDRPSYFTDACSKQLVKDWITHLLNHVNFYTGATYKTDPTILAWELQTEVEFNDNINDPTSTNVASWLTEMVTHIHTLDTMHLITNGEQGWDVPAYTSLYTHYAYPAWMLNGIKGTSFRKNCATVDFCTIHLYPDGWGVADPLGIATAWVQDHQAIAASLGKPLVVGEVGFTDGYQGVSTPTYLNTVFAAVNATATDGTVYWQLQCASLCQGAGQDRATPYPPATGISDALAAGAATAAAKSVTPKGSGRFRVRF